MSPPLHHSPYLACICTDPPKCFPWSLCQTMGLQLLPMATSSASPPGRCMLYFLNAFTFTHPLHTPTNPLHTQHSLTISLPPHTLKILTYLLQTFSLPSFPPRSPRLVHVDTFFENLMHTNDCYIDQHEPSPGDIVGMSFVWTSMLVEFAIFIMRHNSTITPNYCIMQDPKNTIICCGRQMQRVTHPYIRPRRVHANVH